MKTYPAKLLLFGEHTVNLGSQALAIPLPLYSGRWELELAARPGFLLKKQMQLPQFAGFLERLSRRGQLLLPLDVPEFKAALMEGLVFESNIPKGYGAGSSGALVAAVFDGFSHQAAGYAAIKNDLPALKKGFAQAEGFFHGTSSGTDPLICYLQKPILLTKAGVEVVASPLPSSLFLLDTGIERKATPLIAYFLKKWENEDFRRQCQTRLLPQADAAIGAYLSGDWAGLFEAVHRTGEFQFRHLDEMIPPAFRGIWQAGLEGDLFKLKVCGAGGGGFILGITRDFERLRELYPAQKLIPIPAPDS
jgi:mevalonate kinase